MLLTGFFHCRQLPGLEFVGINISPIVGGSVHGEAGRHGAVRADDDVVLPGAAIPLGKMQLAIGILNDSRCAR